MSLDKNLRAHAYFIAGIPACDRTPNDPLVESAIRDVYRLFQGAKTELAEPLISGGTRVSADVILSLSWYAERADDLNCYITFYGNDVCSVEWWHWNGRDKWQDTAISVDNLKEMGLPHNRTLPRHIRRLGGSGPSFR